jgi:hypothetical protein
MSNFDINHIKEFLENSNDKTFKIFVIEYNVKEKNCIDEFKIEYGCTYNHYGSANELIGIVDFLKDIGDNSDECCEIISSVIQKLTKSVCRQYEKEHCWVTIRVNLPNADFLIPRWHSDGRFYTSVNKNETQSKFITVLKGDGTLLCETDESTREKFNKIKNKYNLEGRIECDKLLKSSNSKFKQLTNDQGLVFYVGDPDKSAIHSEPPFKTPRIFLSILPGHVEEIDEWKK